MKPCKCKCIKYNDGFCRWYRVQCETVDNSCDFEDETEPCTKPSWHVVADKL